MLEIQNRSCETKISVSTELCSFWKLFGGNHFITFPDSGRLLDSLFCSSPYLQGQLLSLLISTSDPCFLWHTFSSVSGISSLLKWSSQLHWPHSTFLIVRFLTTSAKSHLSCKVACSPVSEIKMSILEGSVFLSTPERYWLIVHKLTFTYVLIKYVCTNYEI